jgi:Lrp/AsnC family leucine-responsive transcriptional regulator
VFVGVKIEGHANDRAEAFQDAIITMPEIIACHLVAGEPDYLREVRSNIVIQTLKAAAPLPLDHLGATQVQQSNR